MKIKGIYGLYLPLDHFFNFFLDELIENARIIKENYQDDIQLMIDQGNQVDAASLQIEIDNWNEVLRLLEEENLEEIRDLHAEFLLTLIDNLDLIYGLSLYYTPKGIVVGSYTGDIKIYGVVASRNLDKIVPQDIKDHAKTRLRKKGLLLPLIPSLTDIVSLRLKGTKVPRGKLPRECEERLNKVIFTEKDLDLYFTEG